MNLITSVEQSRKDLLTYLCIVIEIRESNGKVLYKGNSRASVTQKWSIAWETDDRIRLNSSDIGIVYWSRKTDGTWIKEQ